MAITLVTGTPGAGKTLNTIEMVHKRAEKEARAVYYANIDGISFDGWHKMDDIEGASIIHDSKDDPGDTAPALVVLSAISTGNRWQTVNSGAGNDLLPSDGVVQAASRRAQNAPLARDAVAMVGQGANSHADQVENGGEGWPMDLPRVSCRPTMRRSGNKARRRFCRRGSYAAGQDQRHTVR